MPKTTFVNGSVVTSDFLNAINNPSFSGLAQDGHFAKIKNSDLDTTAGQILPEWQTFRDALAVSAGTGLSISYIGGSITLEDGSIVTISPGTLSVTANATSFIFVDTTGTVVASISYPVRAIALARVVSGASTITSVVDLRPRFVVRPRFNTVAVFGGIGAQGDYSLASGSASLEGDYYYRNFTLAAGATINVTKGFLYLKCSGDVVINGTINITPPISGGSRFGSGFFIQQYIPSQGQGIGGGTGPNATPPPGYHYAVSPVGSGGASGFVNIAAGASISAYSSGGGNGGGCLIIEAAGTISIGGTIIANGGISANPSIISISSPTVAQMAGGGGGSGGLIFLKSTNSIVATAAATLSVQGGKGGNGYLFGTTAYAHGGGGGGGGYVVMVAPSINTTGATIQLSGGAAGTAAGSATSNGGYGEVGGSNGASFAGIGGTYNNGGGMGQFVTRSFNPA